MGFLIQLFGHVLLQPLGLCIVLLLLLSGDLAEDLVREEVRGRITIEAAAASTAHEAGEERGDLLENEDHDEGSSADGVEDHMRLSESLRVDTCERLDTQSDEFRDNFEETSRLVVFTFTKENVWVGEHVHASEEMDQQGPLDDVASTVSEVRAMAWGRPVELEEQEFVRPVSEEAKENSSKIKNRNGSTKHHDDPNHGNKDREAVVEFDLLSSVLSLVLALNDLASLLLVLGAGAVSTAQKEGKYVVCCSEDWRDAVHEGSGEDRDADNIVPLWSEVIILTVEEEALEADCLQGCLNQTVTSDAVLHNEQDNGGIDELKDPHFAECRLKLSSHGVMALNL